MAPVTSTNILRYVLRIALLQLLLNAPSAFGCYSAIFSFGDSVTDTGNLIHLDRSTEPATRLPYGETYFHHPTGRYSDGRLIIDFIAQSVGVPLVPPYCTGNKSEKFEYGANFAVTGASALKNDFFEAVGIEVTWKDYSLATQLQWFKQLLIERSKFTKADSEEILKNALVIMGEMGVNDYGHFLENGAYQEMHTYAPVIVSRVSDTIHDLFVLGAKTVMVAGMFPMGCMPKFLTMFHSENPEDYDSTTGCIKWLNEFSMHHNNLLKIQLQKLEKFHPRAKIIYADYYRAIMPAYQTPKQFGIDVTLAACCGKGGHYNFDLEIGCGDEAATLCADPSSHISWDGMHLTEAAYRIMARNLLGGEDATPPLDKSCLRDHHSRSWDSFPLPMA